MIDRIRGYLSWAMFVAVLSVVGLCAFLAGDRDPARANIKGIAAKPSFHAGEPFHGIWTLDYLRDLEGRVIRWVTSECNPNLQVYLATEDVRIVSPRPSALPAAGYKIPVAPFIVPRNMPACGAYYHVMVEFYANWFQKLLPFFAIRIVYPVIPFNVLPPKTEGQDPMARKTP
jgi:hypothetical protein